MHYSWRKHHAYALRVYGGEKRDVLALFIVYQSLDNSVIRHDYDAE